MTQSILTDIKKAAKKSLKAREDELANTQKQLEILSGDLFVGGELPFFKDKIAETGQFPLKPKKLEVLQINVGYMCNQVCAHCHVDAGPDRQEIMTRETMEQCLEVIRNTGAHTLDLTGGAPEMNPDFRWFVEEASKAGIQDFIVRSNLTIILANKKYHDLPEFFKKHNVRACIGDGMRIGVEHNICKTTFARCKQSVGNGLPFFKTRLTERHTAIEPTQ